MASTQVFKTSVNTNNSPSQDYTTNLNPDDHSNHNNINIIFVVYHITILSFLCERLSVLRPERLSLISASNMISWRCFELLRNAYDVTNHVQQ